MSLRKFFYSAQLQGKMRMQLVEMTQVLPRSVLPVTTATVERSFSDMKLIKTRLRSRLGEETLNHTMRISIEGLDKLNSEDLNSIIQYWKEKKTRKLMI